MSLQDPSKPAPGSRSTTPAYPCPPQKGSRRMSYSAPQLPSMSSILSRPQHVGPTAQQHPYPPPPESYHPQHVKMEHPLYLSEMNPSAPVQHIYYAPQEHAHTQPQQAEPLLVPIKPAIKPLARPERVAIPPLAPRRQSRKIGRRRNDLEKASVEINKSSAVAGKGRSIEQECLAEPRPQNSSSVTQKECVKRSLESSKQPETSVCTISASSVPSHSNVTSSSSSESPSYATKYNMTVRQQPIAARACGFGERDRRVIDPPPILQLMIEDTAANAEDNSNQHFVVHCTLWDPSTDTDASHMPGATDKKQQRRLMGTLVSSPFYGKDEFNIDGCFFTFPDLSVRTPGTYSLKFKLVTINLGSMGPGHSAPICVIVNSEPFDVFNAKDFCGMRASTELTKRLKHQGCLISVKKGNSKSNNARDDDDDEEDEEEDDQDDSSKPPAAKRQKHR